MLHVRKAPDVTTSTLFTMGAHAGTARRVARAMRTTCRPVAARWGDNIADLDETRRLTLGWLEGLDRRDADVVTWVPGHDGSPGPALLLAHLVGDAWGLPVDATSPTALSLVSGATARRHGPAREHHSRPECCATRGRRREHHHHRSVLGGDQPRVALGWSPGRSPARDQPHHQRSLDMTGRALERLAASRPAPRCLTKGHPR